ncbi:hypothetical protein RIF29_20940 [Crotalaria pallida]|uniref:Uncharacterized protein n=1 Tax=Crotalaria pallida TaxID=3830 RepID=A0AAN9F6I9_CROPI
MANEKGASIITSRVSHLSGSKFLSLPELVFHSMRASLLLPVDQSHQPLKFLSSYSRAPSSPLAFFLLRRHFHSQLQVI